MLPGFANARGNSALTALVEIDPEKSGPLAARYGVARTYNPAQYEECLRSGEVDAVYLAVPNHVHREYAERGPPAQAFMCCARSRSRIMKRTVTRWSRRALPPALSSWSRTGCT